MKRRSFRCYPIVVFSLIVIYSGIADALASCLGDHSNAAAFQHHDTPGNHDHSQDEPIPTLHCASAHSQIGPAVGSASVKLTQSTKDKLSRVSFLPDTLLPEFKNDRWLKALFKRSVIFGLPIDRSRQPFLSVFQI
jgi:hypothetical protein